MIKQFKEENEEMVQLRLPEMMELNSTENEK